MNQSQKENVTSNDRVDLYSRKYYVTACGSADLFLSSKGTQMTFQQKKALKKSKLKPDMTVVDIGCGRGELIYQLGLRCSRVFGLDYSHDGACLSHETKSQLPEDARRRVEVVCAHAATLPFKSQSVDYIFSLEVLEHLADSEINALVSEIIRILKPGGKFVLLTDPNQMYVDWGYKYWIDPMNQLLAPLVKRVLDFKLLPHQEQHCEPTHINLLNIPRLRKHFKRPQLRSKIYTEWFYPDTLMRYVYKAIVYLWPLTLFWPLRDYFCSFIWIEGEKRI